MNKRIVLIFGGLFCIGITLLFGWLAISNNKFVIIFGIVSAFLVPIGMSLLNNAIKRNDNLVFEKISKIPDIESLIEKAKTQEEKVAALKKERKDLAKIIQLETQRELITSRITNLKNESETLIASFTSLDKELKKLDREVEINDLKEQIDELRERVSSVNDNEIVFYTYDLSPRRFDKNKLALHFGGEIAIGFLLFLKGFENFINNSIAKSDPEYIKRLREKK